MFCRNQMLKMLRDTLGVLLTFTLLTPMAWAKLEPKVERTPTLEEKVDGAFGEVVGLMAKVFLMDVIFWDNDSPLSENYAISIQGEEIITDPLGWGIFIRDAKGASLLDYSGQLVQRFNWRGEGACAQVYISPDGRYVWLADGQENLQRVSRTDPEKRDLFKLPEGQLSAVGLLAFGASETDKYMIFGTDMGQSYILHARQTKDGTQRVDFEEVGPKLMGAVVGYASRDDHRYWGVASSGGEIIYFDTKDVKMLKDSAEIWRVSTPAKLHQFNLSKHFLWARTDTSLIVWDSRTGERNFSLQVLGLTAVTTTPDGFVTLDQKGHIRLISPLGEEQKVSDSLKKSTLTQIVDHKDHLWGIEPDGVLKSWKWQKEADPLPQEVAQGVKAFSWSGERLLLRQADQISVWTHSDLKLPFIVLWLVFGACFFTLRMRFVNVRLFKHAILVVSGRYDNPDAQGEVTHFQALSSALSATVGLGNIAGVAIAVSLGGPGATFWMITAGLLGMASKFTECTLGQKYRKVDEQGRVMGGAMHYLSRGFKEEMNAPITGKILAILFAFLCIGGSFGGGNAFQVKQSLGAVTEIIPALKDMQWLYGLIMAILVGIVILGGIKRIAQIAEKIVPAMCGIYVLAALWIILVNAEEIPTAINVIFTGAFSPDALYGGAIGVLVVGFQRAAFSNEAGIGSAAIAHAAAKTEYPVREGVVALLEPFIDTVIVCTMTALVIVITGAYQNPEYGELIASKAGAALTSQAMGEELSFFPYILSIAVILFAYSTMISWSYYGERCWAWLFGENAALFSMGRHASLIYRILFLCFVFLGSIMTATNILDFSDLMILGMALPNILGLLFLSKGVKEDLDVYEEKLRNQEFPIYTPMREALAEGDVSAEADGSGASSENDPPADA